jgi:hypothetical protein
MANHNKAINYVFLVRDHEAMFLFVNTISHTSHVKNDGAISILATYHKVVNMPIMHCARYIKNMLRTN